MNIDRIQPGYIQKVDAVSFFEAQRKNPAKQNNFFNSGLFTSITEGGHNLNYPKVAGSETLAKNLDLVA